MGDINVNEKKALQEKLTVLWDTTIEGQAPARSIQMRTVASAIKKIVNRKENLTEALFWLDSLSRIVTAEDLAIFKSLHGPHEHAGLSAGENKFKSVMVQIAEWIAELQTPTPKKPKYPLTPFKLSNLSIPFTEKQKQETLLAIQKKIKETKSLLFDSMQYQKSDNKIIPYKDLNEYLKIHLFNAVKENRLDELMTILEDNPDVDLNCKDAHGRSLLSVAYLQRSYYHANRTDKYHENKMTLEIETKNALEDIVISEEQKKLFKKLLPSLQEDDTSIEENENILLLLLKKSDINTRTFNNKSILHLAINQETPPSDLMLFLLKDADPNALDQDKEGKDYKTPLQYLLKKDGSLKDEKMHLHQQILELGIPAIFDPMHYQLLDEILKDRKGQKNTLFEKALAVSWIDYALKLDTVSKKGQLLYHLLTHPNTKLVTHIQASFARDKLQTKLIGNWINAAGNALVHKNPGKAADYYKQAAELGNHLAMQNLADLYIYYKTPGDLEKAAKLYARSYFLCEKDKNNGIISGLKKICLQTTDHAARLVAINKLSEIYHSRWDDNRPTHQQLTEQIELLSLIENIPDGRDDEKNKLYEQISQSLAIAMENTTYAEQGMLYYNLLTHPNQRIREEVNSKIKKDNLTQTVGLLILKAGEQIWKTDKDKASHYFEKAGELGQIVAIRNLVSYYHTNEKKLRALISKNQQLGSSENPELKFAEKQLIRSIKLYVKNYHLSADEKEKNSGITILKEIILNEENFSIKKIAVNELNAIYNLRWESKSSDQNLYEQIKYLTFLENMPDINKKIRNDLCKRIIHTIEEGEIFKEIIDENKGYLYYNLLTHSNTMLANHIRKMIEKDQQTMRVSSCINMAGKIIMMHDPEKASQYFQITNDWGNPDGIKHLAGHYLYHGKEQDWEKIIATYKQSYKYWLTDDSRSKIKDALLKMKLRKNNATNKAATDALVEIMTIHNAFYTAIKKAIELLPTPTNHDNMVMIDLGNGSKKMVSPEIATQWTLVNNKDSIETIINIVHDKEPPIEEFKEYYALFNDKLIDVILKKCAEQQRVALWTTTDLSAQPDEKLKILSSWADQKDGILKILNKAAELEDPNNDNFITAMDNWITKFGSAETFSEIDQARQGQLSHRILEFSMSKDKHVLASMLEEKLVAFWKKNKSNTSQKLLSQFQHKKSQFEAALEEKKESLEDKKESNKPFYNRLFSGNPFKRNSSDKIRDSHRRERK